MEQQGADIEKTQTIMASAAPREKELDEAICSISLKNLGKLVMVKLQGALGRLKKKLVDTLFKTSKEENKIRMWQVEDTQLTSKEENKIMKWQEKVEHQKQSSMYEFEKLHQFMSEKEQLLLHRPAKEETLQRLQDSTIKLSQQLSTEVEKLQQERVDKFGMKKRFPSEFFYRLMYPTLQTTRGPWTIEWLTADIVPAIMAHRSFLLSVDWKRVRLEDARQHLPSIPETSDPLISVLGIDELLCGRHYWEVEMGDKTEGRSIVETLWWHSCIRVAVPL